MINDNGANICKSYGSVHGSQEVREFIDFYENKNRIVKKSIYERKYHLENTLNDIFDKYKLYVPCRDREKIHQIFKEVDQILPQINGSRKHMLNINFILKMTFQMLGAQCDHIQIAKSKKTLAIYEQYWNQIMNLIGDKIKRIIQQ